MRKIPTLFVRDEADRAHVTREIAPGCHWVAEGLGVATRKYDGTCVRFHEGRWWTRREVKPGKAAPNGFVELETDPVTHKIVGWEPAEQSPFWRYLQDGIEHLRLVAEQAEWPTTPEPGTYELIGTKVNGNPEGVFGGGHVLLPHGLDVLDDVPRDYDGLREYLTTQSYSLEGIVFWRERGEPSSGMVKIKRKDFAS